MQVPFLLHDHIVLYTLVQVYVISLTWSDGQRYEIYRRYGEFFTFQHTLLQLFPEEGGKGKTAVRIIPSLPSWSMFSLPKHS